MIKIANKRQNFEKEKNTFIFLEEGITGIKLCVQQEGVDRVDVLLSIDENGKVKLNGWPDNPPIGNIFPFTRHNDGSYKVSIYDYNSRKLL